jgi:hypothetical protein
MKYIKSINKSRYIFQNLLYISFSELIIILKIYLL